MVSPKSMYIVQSRCVSLAGRPFLPTKLVNPAFQFIFNSKGCFTDFFTRQHQGVANPFVPRMGAIGLGLAAERTVNIGRDFYKSLDQLSILFSDQSYETLDTYFHSPQEREQWKKDYGGLGYVHDVQDQRMHLIFFELLNPLKLIAHSDGQIVARGKLFIHVYPAGYVVTHLAVTLADSVLKDPSLTESLLKELRPWRKDHKWLWASRLGNWKLNETIDKADHLLYKAFLTDSTKISRKHDWKTSIKIELPTTEQAIITDNTANNGVINHLAHIWLGTSKTDVSESFQFRYYAAIEEMVATKQGTLFIVHPEAKRRGALRIFWSIQFLREIVLLKEQIYRDYTAGFRSEFIRLRELRMDFGERLSEQKLLELSVFDKKIRRHFQTLDDVIKQTSSLYRSLYSYLSESFGLDDTRSRAIELLDEWEKEVAQYEPLLLVIWKKLIAPLRAILTGA